MGNKTVFYALDTDRSLPQVKEAAKKSLAFLGGTILEQGEGFEIKQGINGVKFAFAANLDALVIIRQSAPSRYEFYCTINWSPNALFWVCLIIGFFVFGILWIIPLLYLFMDPSQAYQQALFRVPSLLT